VNAGAAVRVSLIAFGKSNRNPRLDGNFVTAIYADLSQADASNNVSSDLTKAQRLISNRNTCFVGTSKKASFDLSGEIARKWLNLPNVNGKSNTLVVKPWINGSDLVQQPSDTWIVDFGVNLSETEAALFETPFDHILKIVKPEKENVRNQAEKNKWWLHARAAPDMRKALIHTDRFMATSIVAKHRLWVWKNATVLPSHAVCIVARSDDCIFGIIHSRFHELWSLRLGTALEDRPRYTPTTCFETFPFPDKLTPIDTAHQKTESVDGVLIPVQLTDTATHKTRSIAINIAKATAHLVQTRDNWLNPPEWVEWVQSPEETAADFPKRAIAKPGHEAELKKKTLTNLYNARPAWLSMAHEAIDKAVATAYGWTDYTPAMSDDEILKRLLALNLSRATTGSPETSAHDKETDDDTNQDD
jgi:hypothetical protein